MAATRSAAFRPAAILVALLAFVGFLIYGHNPLTASADHAPGGGQQFTFLQPGFTQDVYGVTNGFMGGIAFRSNGDPLSNDCAFGGSPLHDFQRAPAPLIVHTTPIQPHVDMSSNAGCGMTNHPNGSIYTNTSSGAVRLNPDTGAQIGAAFGPPGDALGIATDPQTSDLVYVGSNGTIQRVNAALTTTSVFSTVTTGNFVDGIAWDPTGNFLFMSNRSPIRRLTILHHDGTLAQHVALTSEPDGISFHAETPKFVVTNNTDGTMTRFDFPADNYDLPPVASVFASGGFRGDISQVGPDGCLYAPQAGTRYNDGFTSGENNMTRICGGFAPPPGVKPADQSSLKLNGTTAYAEAPNAAKLNPTGDYSYEVWFKDENPKGFNHDFATLINKGDRANNGESPFLVTIGSKHLKAGLRANFTDYVVDYDLRAGGVDPTKWHHLALTVDSRTRTLTLYLDGVQVGTTVAGALSSNNALPLEMGRNSAAAGKYFMGKLDDLRIWNVKRSGAEIAANYKTEFSANPAGLVANWKYDEGVGTVAHDSVAPAADATLHGGAVFDPDHPQTP